jgi:hypothetical protein
MLSGDRAAAPGSWAATNRSYRLSSRRPRWSRATTARRISSPACFWMPDVPIAPASRASTGARLARAGPDLGVEVGYGF